MALFVSIILRIFLREFESARQAFPLFFNLYR